MDTFGSGSSSAATHGSGSHGESTPHDLFALTDEQILEIDPREEVAGDPSHNSVGTSEWPRKTSHEARATKPTSSVDSNGKAITETNAAAQSSFANHQASVTSHDAAEPPLWLADAMNDPQNGGEARELWNGVVQARQEAAAYREVFAKPEEARTAAERAQVLDELDRAYFGVVGSSAEQTSVARAQLATRMLEENPAAFREMVFAGLRALEEAGKGNREVTKQRNNEAKDDQYRGFSSTQSTSQNSSHEPSGRTQNTAQDAQLAAYAAFEKVANEELERSVGVAITRTIEQALPNASRHSASGQAGAGPSLQERLIAVVRADVEKALQGDRQLGEQVAQILSARRLDNETRAQVVRLIGERAQQLVPGTARRVINEWTQTTLATHRSRTQRTDVASARKEVEPASSPGSQDATQNPHTQKTRVGHPATSSPQGQRGVTRTSAASSNAGKSRGVDYRKLSDEQILDL